MARNKSWCVIFCFWHHDQYDCGDSGFRSFNQSVFRTNKCDYI